MKRFSFLIMFIFIILISNIMYSQKKASTNLLVRCDDLGMCHTVNMAAVKLIETGIPFSTSVMFACPWYQEAVEILKNNPQISVGVHLMLNSEWKSYKWSPIEGKTVPTLVDSNGFFYESEDDFKNSKYSLVEVEKELRAQINRAVNSGLKIDYVDHHMGTASSTPELNAIVEKLAKEYNLGISRYFEEEYETLWDIAPELKLSKLLEITENLKEGKTNLLVIHLGLETPEMEALIDMNNPEDPYRVSKHRSAELNALCTKAFEKAILKNDIKFITYRNLIAEKGLKNLKGVEDVYGK